MQVEVAYRLDDVPPKRQAIVFGVQHVLTMFGTVTVPLLLGPQLGLERTQVATLISAVMLSCGVATLLQARFGTRLPIIQGTSFSFLAAFFYVIHSQEVQTLPQPERGHVALQYIAGAIILGAIIELVIGFTGLIGRLRRVFTPVVVGPVIMLIGLGLFQHGAPKAGQHWPTAVVVIVSVLVASFVVGRHIALFKVLPILFSLAVGIGLSSILTLAGIYEAGHPAHVDVSVVGSAAWVRSPLDLVFPWGMPKFHIGFFFAMLAGYVASMVESVGDYHACARMAGASEVTEQQISRGIGFEGLGCALAGVFGGFATTSYSENIGLVGLTKIASRHVVVVAAFVMIGLGLFAKFGALIAVVPDPVVGGLYCVLFGLISAFGVQQLAQANLQSDRNLMIVGFSLFMGLSVPAYFGAMADPQTLHPGDTLAIYTPTATNWLSQLPQQVGGIVSAIGKSGMAVAAIFGVALDNLLPGKESESVQTD